MLGRLAAAATSIVLAGEMGAGKTAFAQGFGRAIGVTEPITSPTFTLVHSYPAGKLTLHHADLYRLSTHAEVADLALGELAESDGIVLVEWGDVVAGDVSATICRAVSSSIDDDERRRAPSRSRAVRPRRGRRAGTA